MIRLGTSSNAAAAANIISRNGLASVGLNGWSSLTKMWRSTTATPAAAAATATGTNSGDMFCFQCEQTNSGTGCTTIGVCGKTPEVAAMQDLLVKILKDVSAFASSARTLGHSDRDLDVFVLKAMFSTLTNVNFDPARFQTYIKEAVNFREKAFSMYTAGCADRNLTPTLKPIRNDISDYEVDSIVRAGHQYGVENRRAVLGADIAGLQELITYGVKGLSAYSEHAFILGKDSEKIFSFVQEALSFLNTDRAKNVDELVKMALRVGEVNLLAMELLDNGGVGKFGHPSPAMVQTGVKKGKAILVSGHDLYDLETILKMSEGSGVNVYTHGELLPAHGYPGLRKFAHLAGNFGNAWQLQKFEFAQFPGPIVVTTNCLIEPRKSYKDRLYTSGVAGWPGVKHISKPADFQQVIDQALKLDGFAEDRKDKEIMVGFGRNAVLSAAGQIIEAIKAGNIKKFFVIGGCDGAEGERSYFRDLALKLPKDNVILTLGCGKYRFNKFDFGTVPNTGIPRLLDVGQCNDTYSAIQIASALSGALNTPINDLPLYFAISWFEQKAVAVLLTMLHLGIRNIHLGPALPAFVTPNVLKVLQDTFDLKKTVDPITDFKL